MFTGGRTVITVSGGGKGLFLLFCTCRGQPFLSFFFFCSIKIPTLLTHFLCLALTRLYLVLSLQSAKGERESKADKMGCPLRSRYSLINHIVHFQPVSKFQVKYRQWHGNWPEGGLFNLNAWIFKNRLHIEPLGTQWRDQSLNIWKWIPLNVRRILQYTSLKVFWLGGIINKNVHIRTLGGDLLMATKRNQAVSYI